ncbi:PREDICTED: ameloblastin [Miniopterus natalensis]|uniref:ameloblastin n=1 Tax=Miniopterus natalensis TaxID=291302 RepID=UPI0007A6CD36|nr:PREDICTED: ameloblastin [Miniopterus natalensis]
MSPDLLPNYLHQRLLLGKAKTKYHCCCKTDSDVGEIEAKFVYCQNFQNYLGWHHQALRAQCRPALKIPLFKMKNLILILCLLEMSSAVPVFPQQPGTPGMASLSLETMRQLGTLQGLNMLSQYSRFGFGKSFNSLWMHGLLPPHSSFPWLRPREHETQQYEYSLPVHPPPLPSQPSLQPHQPGQKPFLHPTVVTAIQDTIQKGGPQPPVYQGQPPLQQEEGPIIQQQVAPSDKPPKAELPGMDFADPQGPSIFSIARLISQGPLPQNKPSPLYPGMFYMSYGANQLNAPTRLGIMSSEEMAGGRGGPMAYGAMFPGFGGMRPSLGGMPPHPGMGGDFTLEFDSPVAATKGPEKGEGIVQSSPVPEVNPANPENPALLPEVVVPSALGGLLALPKGDIPNLARGPAGHSKGSPRVTPAAADPLMTPGLAEGYESYGADTTTPLGETTVDTTVTPDTEQTSMPGNKAQQPHIMHNAWHFQEP